MFAVVVEFNTDENNKWVFEERMAADEPLPMCIFGPFKDLDAAQHWMDDIYPDGDTDVHEMYSVNEEFTKEQLNNPEEFARQWGHENCALCESNNKEKVA